MSCIPIIFSTQEDSRFIEELNVRIRGTEGSKYLTDYPTVYLHYWVSNEVSYTDKNGVSKSYNQYDVYVGESNNVLSRTRQHYLEGEEQANWQYKLTHSKKSIPKFIVIGHKYFNKSFTLDLENRLIEYIMSVPRTVRKIHNGRGNPQNMYFPQEYFKDVFKKVWRKLGEYQSDLFPAESVIFNSAIFKASPLKKLSSQQREVKDLIIERVFNSVNSGIDGQLIFVQGEAGTGKTVLTTSTFYELTRLKDVLEHKNDLEVHLLVNHEQQLAVYKQMAERLDIGQEHISKPTSFINNHTCVNKVDVCFIDEGHLLLTQGKMSYRGKNQLQDIMNRSKVVVVMFDEDQVLTTEEYWESEVLDEFKTISEKQGNFIQLHHQFRMNCAESTKQWLKSFIYDRRIERFKPDKEGYEIKSFNSPLALHNAIKKKANEKGNELSRLVASYDWDYSDSKVPSDRDYWDVRIGDWSLPWNYEIARYMGRKEKRYLRNLSWAEQNQTLDEVGSTFTVQGFDLSYVGVILGPSVKFKDGHIEFCPSESKNDKATRKRTLSDGRTKQFGKDFIRNEVKVLMTRGIKGLYLYAVDPELREALKEIALISTD